MKKIIGCVNVTNNGLNDHTDDYNLITRVADKAHIEKIAELTVRVNDLNSQKQLKPFTKGLKYASLIIWVATALLFIVGLFIPAENTSFEELSTLLIIAPVAFVIWYVIRGYERRMKFDDTPTEESEKLDREIERLFNNANQELRIPNNAVNLDIICYFYRVSNDEIHIIKQQTMPTKYLNIERKFFVEENKLCMAGTETVIAFDFDNIKSVKRVDDHIVLPLWNKETDFNEGKYEKHNISVNNQLQLRIDHYYSAKIIEHDQEYELLIPNYDIEEFLRITGKQISN